jgi:predicted ATPase
MTPIRSNFHSRHPTGLAASAASIPPAKSAFAIPVAMCMIAIVAVAMTAVCALLAADIRRTLNGSADAQLRQLLLAAELDAPSHLSDASEHQWTTPLPLALSSFQLTTTRLSDSGSLHITATLDRRTLAEDLHFDPTPTGWHLTTAQLFPPTSHP